MNLRASYGRTLDRPTFRELAPFASFSFVGGFTFIGNAELERTMINNCDLRWEHFGNPGELYAASVFYKVRCKCGEIFRLSGRVGVGASNK